MSGRAERHNLTCGTTQISQAAYKMLGTVRAAAMSHGRLTQGVNYRFGIDAEAVAEPNPFLL